MASRNKQVSLKLSSRVSILMFSFYSSLTDRKQLVTSRPPTNYCLIHMSFSPSSWNDFLSSEGFHNFVSSFSLAGGVGGVCLWTICFPLDMVKSRIQVYNIKESTITVLISVARKEGIKALYQGLTPALVRTFPATGALFLTYEHSKDFLVNIWMHLWDRWERASTKRSTPVIRGLNTHRSHWR